MLAALCSIAFFIFALAHATRVEQLVGATLAVPDNAFPGENPPFYFIRRDFVDGICASAAAILMLALSACTWRFYRLESAFVVFLAGLMCAPAIEDVLIISVRCHDLLDARRATSDWATLKEYLYDPFRWFAHSATYFGSAA